MASKNINRFLISNPPQASVAVHSESEKDWFSSNGYENENESAFRMFHVSNKFSGSPVTNFLCMRSRFKGKRFQYFSVSSAQF